MGFNVKVHQDVIQYLQRIEVVMEHFSKCPEIFKIFSKQRQCNKKIKDIMSKIKAQLSKEDDEDFIIFLKEFQFDGVVKALKHFTIKNLKEKYGEQYDEFSSDEEQNASKSHPSKSNSDQKQINTEDKILLIQEGIRNMITPFEDNKLSPIEVKEHLTLDEEEQSQQFEEILPVSQDKQQNRRNASSSDEPKYKKKSKPKSSKRQSKRRKTREQKPQQANLEEEVDLYHINKMYQYKYLFYVMLSLSHDSKTYIKNLYLKCTQNSVQNVQKSIQNIYYNHSKIYIKSLQNIHKITLKYTLNLVFKIIQFSLKFTKKIKKFSKFFKQKNTNKQSNMNITI
ncbi:unnamed protein product [Paramecium octaurelia]|uniref:Uncharacterized protein n=1 Tax=Paramecium octaurelia TaxID=43137 RepID=A0A8S1YP81_PAROT|nr:unnamed protein product [Paramecium octaurelia]